MSLGKMWWNWGKLGTVMLGVAFGIKESLSDDKVQHQGSIDYLCDTVISNVQPA